MKISIIIPCYNGQNFVADAIASALAQTHRDIECIVADDASTDASREIIADFADHDDRVKPIFLPTNRGAAVARNEAIDAATGEWITFLDADDLYKQDRLHCLLELAAATGADAVMDNQSVRDFPDGPHLFKGFRFLQSEEPTFISQDLYFAEEAYIGRYLRSGYMKPMIRSSFIRERGLRFNPEYRSGQDALFFGELVSFNPRFFGTGYPGYIYRRRPASLSRSGPSDLRKKAKISDEIMKIHHARLNTASQKALAKRKADLERYAALHAIKLGIQDGAWKDVLSAISTKPDALLVIPYILRRQWASLVVDRNLTGTRARG